MILDKTTLAQINLTEQELMLTMSKYEPRTILANNFFLKEGQVSTQIGFVTKGILRAYFYDDHANEITTAFYPEGSLVLSSNSFNNQVPSKENIVAIEDTELMVIGYENQKELYNLIPAWNAICKDLADRKGIELLQRTSRFQTLSATERYELFCQEHKDLLQRVNLGQIASYLGIDIATLSRIRKRK